MRTLVDLIEEATSAGGLDLEQAVLAARSAEDVAEAVAGFVAPKLGRVERALFYRRSTGLVIGLLLASGEEVVVKLHRWQVSIERLAAVHEVQLHLARAGLPAPKPLLPPQVLGNGIVTVEELRWGSRADGHSPVVCRVLAESLLQVVRLARPLRGLSLGLTALLQPDGPSPYPAPHDLRFDFERTAAGAEWIDELAVRAHQILSRDGGEHVVGHLDWCVGNLGFVGSELSAIYDWDSVALASEPVVVGFAAAEFTSDWSLGAALPSLEEARLFVDEYERARAEPFSPPEKEVINAASLLLCAYGARCQHSDLLLGLADSEEGWITRLRERQHVDG